MAQGWETDCWVAGAGGLTVLWEWSGLGAVLGDEERGISVACIPRRLVIDNGDRFLFFFRFGFRWKRKSV